MAKRLKKIKKDHSVISGVLPLLEKISKMEEVKRVIPAVISRKGKVNSNQPVAFITVQRETTSGLKLLAHTHEGIQEIFLVVPKKDRKKVTLKIMD